MTDFYDDAGSFANTGGRARRYWPGDLTFESWQRLPIAQRERRGMVDYVPPSAQGWGGFAEILNILRRVWLDDDHQFDSVLDVGCSTGVWLQHTIAAGIPSWGVDASAWAVEHPIAGVPAERLHRMSVGEDEWPEDIPDEVELVTAFDFLEHVFEVDVERVVDEMLHRSRRYVALCVCAISPGSGETPWSATKGTWEGPDHLDDRGQPIEWVRHLGATSVPPERLWQAVSGHVTMQSTDWWYERLQAAGLVLDWQAMQRFELYRREFRSFCYGLPAGVFSMRGHSLPIPFPGGLVDQVASWGPRCVILGRVDQ